MISVLCPTRGRPQQFNQMLESIRKTTRTLVETFARFDGDDKTVEEATRGRSWNPSLCWTIGMRISLSEIWNECANRALGDLLMLCADDVVFQTPGWDVMVEQAFEECPDKILCVYGDDGGPHGKEFASLPIVSRAWVETVGYFTPPGFAGDFCDTWIQDIALALGRRKFLPFVCEHMHWAWGKSEYDTTYREKDERDKANDPTPLYWSRLSERVRDANKLGAKMNPPHKMLTEYDLDTRIPKGQPCPRCESQSTVVAGESNACNACGNWWPL